MSMFRAMTGSTLFHPAVIAWFERTFRSPTAAQAQAWPAIKAGRNVLIAAPTGSGKTFAAFMAAIDSLVRQGAEGALRDETQVVYVSPLKALSNDIQKNLEEPLSRLFELRCGSRAWAMSRSGRGCAPVIHLRQSANAWPVGHRTSSLRRRNLFTSCLDLIAAAGCSRPPER